MQDETNNPQEDLEAGVAELEEIMNGLIPQDVLDQAAEQGRPVEVNISDVNVQMNEEGGTFSPSETGDVLPGETATTDTTADPAADPLADPTFEETGSGTALPLDESLAEPPAGTEAPITINISDVNVQMNEEGGDFLPTESGDVLPDGDPTADLSADPLADPAAENADPVDDLFLDPAVDPTTDPSAEDLLAEDPLVEPVAEDVVAPVEDQSMADPTDPLADSPTTEWAVDANGDNVTDNDPNADWETQGPTTDPEVDPDGDGWMDYDPNAPGEQEIPPSSDMSNPINEFSPFHVDQNQVMDDAFDPW